MVVPTLHFSAVMEIAQDSSDLDKTFQEVGNQPTNQPACARQGCPILMVQPSVLHVGDSRAGRPVRLTRFGGQVGYVDPLSIVANPESMGRVDGLAQPPQPSSRANARREKTLPCDVSRPRGRCVDAC